MRYHLVWRFPVQAGLVYYTNVLSSTTLGANHDDSLRPRGRLVTTIGFRRACDEVCSSRTGVQADQACQ
jgi:hypothetical protein